MISKVWKSCRAAFPAPWVWQVFEAGSEPIQRRLPGAFGAQGRRMDLESSRASVFVRVKQSEVQFACTQTGTGWTKMVLVGNQVEGPEPALLLGCRRLSDALRLSEFFKRPMSPDDINEVLLSQGVNQIACTLMPGRCGSTFLASLANPCRIWHRR